VPYKPTSFPLGAMPLTKMKPAVMLDLLPGDILVLLSDGFYEYHDASGEQFGERRVEEIVREHGDKPTAELLARLFRGGRRLRARRAAGRRHDRRAREARRARRAQ